MGSDLQTTTLRMLVEHDPRLGADSVWSAESSYTQQTPIAGDAIAQQSGTRLVLEASGSQTADTTLNVAAQSPGFPAADRVGASLRWKTSADATNAWYGWEPQIDHWESIEWLDGTGSYTYEWTRNPACLSLAGGKALVAVDTKVHGANTYALRVYNWSAGTWTGVTVESISSSSSVERHPCLVQQPNGRVLLYCWSRDQGVLQVWESTDDGTTWTLINRGDILLGDLTGDAVVRMRAAFGNGQVLLIVHSTLSTATNTVDHVDQFASRDGGLTFEKVATLTADDSVSGMARPDVAFWDGTFTLASLEFTTTTGNIKYRQVGNAFDSLGDATANDTGFDTGSFTTSGGAGAATGLTDGDIALFVTDNGSPIVIIRFTGSNHRTETQPLRLDNVPRHWPRIEVADLADADTHLRNYCACFHRGRLLLPHNCDSTGTIDESLICSWWGGASRLTFIGRQQSFSAGGNQLEIIESFHPIDLPTNFGSWGKTGTATEALTADGYQITASSQQLYFTAASSHDASTTGWGMMGTIKLSAYTSGEVVMRVAVDDGSANRWEASLRFTAGQIEVYDEQGATSKATASVTLTSDVRCVIIVGRGLVSAWYCENPDQDPYAFTQITAGTSIASGATSSVGIDYIFGQHTSGTATHVWRSVHELQNIDADYGLSYAGAEVTTPDDLYGRALSSTPLWLGEGVSVRAADGPAITGQQHNIVGTAEYPATNILPSVSPSPEETWRSTAVSTPASTNVAEQQIALQLDSNTSAHTERGTIGFILLNCNWRTGRIEGHDGSSWSTLISLDTATGWTGLSYTREGNTVTVASSPSGTGALYCAIDEAKGGTLELDAGGTPSRFTIARNTEGIWIDPTTTVTPTFTIEGDPTGVATSGTLNVWFPRLAGVIHLKDTTDDLKGYRLVIDSQKTVDGWSQVGVFLIGPTHAMLQQYSRGRVIEVVSGTEVTESLNGRRRAVKRSEAWRRATVSWAEVRVDSSPLYRTSPSPDFTTGTSTSGARPISMTADIALKVQALIRRRFVGALHPIGYFPSVARGVPDTAQWVSEERHIYGRVVGGNARAAPLGDELSSEMMVAGRVVIEEER